MAAPEVRIDLDGCEVIITRSSGLDGAVYVIIDTDFEPDGSDGGPGLRVDVNDGNVFTGVAYVHDHGEDRCPLETSYGTGHPTTYCTRSRVPGREWCAEHLMEWGRITEAQYEAAPASSKETPDVNVR